MIWPETAGNMSKKGPRCFSPPRARPFDQDSLPLGLVKKFVPDTGLNDRILMSFPGGAPEKPGVGAEFSMGLTVLLETVRNLYHMSPLYREEAVWFSHLCADPQGKARCAPGCSILCIQQKDRTTWVNKPGLGSRRIDFGKHTSGK